MKKSNNNFFNFIEKNLSSVPLMLLVISFFSVWSIFLEGNLINRDGLLYLKQAFLFSENNFTEAVSLYPHYVFGLLISIVHKITNLDFIVVARCLNLILFITASFYYLKTIETLSKNNNDLMFGGLILLSCISIMDDYVPMILRDHGFWAGCMAGTYYLLRFVDRQNFSNTFLWQLSFFVAFLFRPEALVFSLLVPFLILFLQPKEITNFNALINFFKNNLFTFGYIVYKLIKDQLEISFLDNAEVVNRTGEFKIRFIEGLYNLISGIPLSSNDYFLSNLLSNYPFVISIGTLCSILFYKWLSGIGVIKFMLLSGYFKIKQNFFSQSKIILYFFILVSFLLVASNLVSVFVLSNRYWVAHHFWMMILLTPVLSTIYNRSGKYLPYRKFLIYLILFVCASAALLDSKKNSIEMEAGYFIKNMNLNGKSIQLIDSDRTAFYGGLSLEEILDFSKQSNNNAADIIIYQGGRKKIAEFYKKDLTYRNYKLYKKFVNSKEGVFIFKRVTND